ncbi:molybdenum cofactor sulfurase [Heterostelium album PN500]|uniref:Molybdenum cofactor sulfurase n=1 Tax=Heterostelium pallidum (strain ATCC 26659 / Pp 5 / PN500) TaxID=670386 RepID=D3BH81_HETP5|nr:molybdenum cofactor sulfurase [Heterostelium album PN500]EFA79465.1 molybdenum cofactor sulfurase [Heterostelium album PN500]|eukprot:XP_020431586.1 molybdenum cofactor sulfurase [Heterostelium album PN500]
MKKFSFYFIVFLTFVNHLEVFLKSNITLNSNFNTKNDNETLLKEINNNNNNDNDSDRVISVQQNQYSHQRISEFEKQQQSFLNQYSDSYGYNQRIDHIRNNDFSVLNGKVTTQSTNCCYLDHTASTIPSSVQLDLVNQDLKSTIYANPHSLNPIGLKTTESIDQARERILQLFSAPYRQYTVVFTSGCTDALKKVGEYFPWQSKHSTFFYSTEAHNSLLGIREYAAERGSKFRPIQSAFFKQSNNSHFNDIVNVIQREVQPNDGSYSLLAFPAQCNYNGSKYNLEVIKILKQKFKNLKILLDVASFVPTSPFDLSEYPADFIALSFYKMFGYPTGLGALIIKNDCFPLLNKVYFGGGTVNASLSYERFHVFRDVLHQKFEDGTLPYQSIVSLKYGLDILDGLGMENIKKHTFSLIQYLRDKMVELKHSNGSPLLVIYADNHYIDSNRQGAIINFNVLKTNGQPVGFNEVEKLASLCNIHLRIGCFCNPGACHSYLSLTRDDVEKHLKDGHVCWDDKDIIDGKLTGSIRVSLGYMSNFKDIFTFIEFLKDNFIDENHSQLSSPCVSSSINGQADRGDIYLSEINVYPVKSFGAFTVDEWEIGPSGLLYDREWTLIDQNGVYINQKKLPVLSLISTHIDLQDRVLKLKAPEMPELVLPLDYYPRSSMDVIQVCGDSVEGLLYGKDDLETVGDVSNWMYTFTGKQCHLVRKNPDSHRKSRMAVKHNNNDSTTSTTTTTEASKGTRGEEISFANESPFLMISESSVKDLRDRVVSRNQSNSLANEWNWITTSSFRANFVIKGGYPYEEDGYDRFTIGENTFQTIGLCNRCKMICINQTMGIEEKEPLATLSTYRRNQGKIVFGQHLQYVESQEGCDGTIKKLISIHSKVERINNCNT